MSKGPSKKLFKSHITQLSNVVLRAKMSCKMDDNWTTIILGRENAAKRDEAIKLIEQAILILSQIERK